MLRPHELAFEAKPGNFLRAKYFRDRNPQYAHLTNVIGSYGGSVLDVGCASCIMYPLLKDKVDRYVGLDITQKFLDHAKLVHPEIEVKLGSILDIPFPDNSFDTVFCKSVILHLDPKEMPRAISEMMRVASKRAVIGFRTLPGEKGSVSMSKGFFYVVYRKQEVMDVVTNHEKFESVEVLVGKPYRNIRTAIYLVSVKESM